ncbi:MAG TPA: hypothetical protein VFO90_04325 [Terrimicrobiaceae bacterium]|nr:hypothetical protein [Terrimicrobiaceae bacterium]
MRESYRAVRRPKSEEKNRALHGDTNALQAAIIFQAHSAALEEINQGRESLPAVAGTGRDDADEFTQRITVPVNLAVSIFHGVRNSYKH